MSKKYLRICVLLVIINILMFAVIADSQTNKLPNFTSPYIRQICNFAPNAGICTECYQDTCYPLPLEYTNYVFDKYRDECVPLSYGGCSGNLNNFEIKEDCEATCPSFVKKTNVTADPQETDSQNFTSPTHPTEICNLVPDMGLCTKCTSDGCYTVFSHFRYIFVKRYAYNKHKDECVPFPHGNCMGNDNNFGSKEACEATCPSLSKKTNITTNITDTQESQNSELCNLDVDYGVCTECNPDGHCHPIINEIYTRFAYNKYEKKCLPFSYEGCGGNENNFRFKVDCEAICLGLATKTNIITDTQEFLNSEACNLDLDDGVCTECNPDGQCYPILNKTYIRYAYNKHENKCLPFTYGGCGGNNNNFISKVGCEATCSSLNKKTSITTDSQEIESQNSTSATKSSEVCYLDLNYGVCTECDPDGHCHPIINEVYTRYAYNKYEDKCLPFSYEGCGGNGNNFISKVGCEATCLRLATKTDIITDTRGSQNSEMCNLDFDRGLCIECYLDGCYLVLNQVYTRYAYNKYENKCVPFTYGGCGGNKNNFRSKADCIATCSSRGKKTNKTTDPQEIESQNSTSAIQNSEACNLDPVLTYCYVCNETTCTPLSFPLRKYYYDKQTKKCERLPDTICGTNANSFISKIYCEITCLNLLEKVTDFSKTESQESTSLFRQVCNLFPDMGICTECYQDTCYPLLPEYTRYAYDKTKDECVPFSYGGCGGNFNNFMSKEACEITCLTLGNKTNVTADPQETDSQDFTSPTHPTEICNLVPNIGLCTHCNRDGCYSSISFYNKQHFSNRKFYAYNKHKDECELFPYAGCGGNVNNFNSKADCETACPSIGKKTNVTADPGKTESQSSISPKDLEICNLDPNVGYCNQCSIVGGNCYGPGLKGHSKYGYDKYKDKCNLYEHHGCGDNDNYFISREDCEATCLGRQTSVTSDIVITEKPQSPSTQNPNICNLHADVGYSIDFGFRNLKNRYWYNKNTDKCESFIYLGNGGNDNNFESKTNCEATCLKQDNVQTQKQDICSLYLNNGSCSLCDTSNCVNSTRYWYNRNTEKCEQFLYSGCGGNNNNFEYKLDCEATCHGPASPTKAISPQVCYLGPNMGICYHCKHLDCSIAISPPYKRYYYNKYEKECMILPYGGCKGNANNFDSKEFCETLCNRAKKNINRYGFGFG